MSVSENDKNRTCGQNNSQRESVVRSTVDQQLVPDAKMDWDSNMELRLAAGRQIARMEEPWLLTKDELAESKIIYRDTTGSHVVNAFRGIRTKLLQVNGQENCTILVTSICKGGGSSFVARNLAVAFSFDEAKTALLLDCNLTAPSCHDLISYEACRGITDYLSSSELGVEQIIHPVGIPRLRLIPAGVTNNVESEYFMSLKMRKLLRDVSERYSDRYVIIDAPPVLESADTHILAELCDFVLLVVPYGMVVESRIMTAAKGIGEQKLLGIIFNDEPQLQNFSMTRRSKRRVSANA